MKKSKKQRKSKKSPRLTIGICQFCQAWPRRTIRLMKPITSRFNLAGVQYSDYQLYDEYKPGIKLDLTWERSNKFDANAIAVYYQGIRIGYVPKGEHQEVIHKYRKAGLKTVTYLRSYNPTNPTWNMFTVEVLSAESPAEKVEDVPL